MQDRATPPRVFCRKSPQGIGLIGRKTYEAGVRLSGGKFQSYGLRCYIFSRSLLEGERDGAIFVREEPKRVVEELRTKKGKDIWLAGGGELAREFLKEDLVDELYLGIVLVLAGIHVDGE